MSNYETLIGRLKEHIPFSKSNSKSSSTLGDTDEDIVGEIAGEVVSGTASKATKNAASKSVKKASRKSAKKAAKNIVKGVTENVAGEVVGEVAGESAAKVAKKVAGEAAEKASGNIVGNVAGEVAGETVGGALAGVLKSVGSTVAIAAAVGTVAYAAYDWLTESFDEAKGKAGSSRAAYQETVSEVEHLASQLDTTKSRIEEIKVQGKLSLTDEAELQRLEAQNDSLERQLEIKKKLANRQQDDAASDAENVLTKEISWKSESNHLPGNANTKSSLYVNGDIIDRATEKQQKLNESKKKQAELEAKLAKLEPDKEPGGLWGSVKNFFSPKSEYRKTADALKEIKSDVEKYEKEFGDDLTEIEAQYSSLLDDNNNIIEGHEEIAKRSKAILDSYGDANLSDAEKKLKRISGYFDGTGGKNFIKDNLLDAAKQAKLTADDVERMGIAIDGVDASDIARYFNEMAESANVASEAINGVTVSVADVKAAQESANQDQDWAEMAEALEKAKKLREEGKVGTDDFKTAAQFMRFDKIDPDKFKYDSDAFIAVWEDAEKKIKRYFDAENPLESIQNFTKDLVDKGFATKSGDEFTW